jgi:hypothetical protein
MPKCPTGTYRYKGACIDNDISAPAIITGEYVDSVPHIDQQQVVATDARWRRRAMGWAASAVVSALAVLLLKGWLLRILTIVTLVTALVTLLWWAGDEDRVKEAVKALPKEMD